MSTQTPHPHQPFVPTRPDGRPDRPGLATAIAIVDIVGGMGCLAIGAAMAIAGATSTESDAAQVAVVGGIFVVMGLLVLGSGIGLLLMAPWGRICQIVTSILGLCCIGPGTIVNALILAYMFQRKVVLTYSGRRVADMSEPEKHLLVPSTQSGGGGGGVGIVVAVVVGFFVMIMVVGMLAAIAIPNLLNAIQRGKQKRTMADMRTIATAIEAHGTDHNAFPTATSVDELIPALVPTYAQSLPTKDAWEHPFDVSTTGLTYTLRSAGKDERYEVDDPALYTRGATTSFADDLVFSNGEFVRYPEGSQH
jgi:general secretion pathway protein G